MCETPECANLWRKARRGGRCYECLRNDSAQQVFCLILHGLDSRVVPLICSASGARFSSMWKSRMLQDVEKSAPRRALLYMPAQRLCPTGIMLCVFELCYLNAVRVLVRWRRPRRHGGSDRGSRGRKLTPLINWMFHDSMPNAHHGTIKCKTRCERKIHHRSPRILEYVTAYALS